MVTIFYFYTNFLRYVIVAERKKYLEFSFLKTLNLLRCWGVVNNGCLHSVLSRNTMF